MARGDAKSIIVSTVHQQQKFEGIISGTPKPGTCMTLKNTALSGTRFTWEAFNAGGRDGGFQIICVLLEDDKSGSNSGTAYTNGARGFLYCPASGEQLNMLVADLSGTASASELYSIGQLFTPQDAVGKLLPQNLASTPARKPFVSLEATVLSSAYAADTLHWMMYTGF